MFNSSQFHFVALLVMIISPFCPAEPPKVRNQSAVIHLGKLLVLRNDGDIHAWDLKTADYEKDSSSLYSMKPLSRLATDGKTLWAGEADSLYRWEADKKKWEKLATFKGGPVILDVVIVAGTPWIVTEGLVIDPVGQKSVKIPEANGRILAIHASETKLWIGTGRGEWGGELLGFDPKTEQWVQKRNSMSYVTGITHADKDDVIVSWSMSHLGIIDTEISVHKPDGEPRKEYPNLRNKYYQRVAWNPHDKTLYAVENADLVTVSDGKPTKLVALDGDLYEREPDAIGSAPALISILPTASKAMAVIPRKGDPWLWQDGKLKLLLVK